MSDRKTVRRPQGSGGSGGGLAKFLNIGVDKDHPEFLNIGTVRQVRAVMVEKDGGEPEFGLRLVFRNSVLDLQGEVADYVLSKVDGNRDFFRREITVPDKKEAEVSYINLGCVETALNTSNPEGAIRLYWVGSDDQSPQEDKDYVVIRQDEVEKFHRHMGKYVKSGPPRRSSKKAAAGV